MRRPTVDPDDVSRLIAAFVVLYFVLLVYAGVTRDVTAELTADVLFGLIAIGVGASLYRGSSDGFSPTVGAAMCFVAGGVAQLGAVVLSDPLLDLLSTVAVFVGLVLYVYAVWIAK